MSEPVTKVQLVHIGQQEEVQKSINAEINKLI